LVFQDYIDTPLPFDREISKYFRPDDLLTIFEIGSCEGEDSIRLKRRFPNAAVYTFEPVPANVAKIRANFRNQSLPTDNLYEFALSDQNGVAPFYVSSGHPEGAPTSAEWDYGNKSSSLLPPKEHTRTHPWLKFDQTLNVATERLDSFCERKEIDEIDLVWLDVQGAELMVLEGAGEMISRIGVIWLEVGTIEFYERQPLKNDVEGFMRERGFTCEMDRVDETTGDQLYVSRYMRGQRRGLGKALSRIVGMGRPGRARTNAENDE
jgi:FkbM family methyltransferase